MKSSGAYPDYCVRFAPMAMLRPMILGPRRTGLAIVPGLE